jgi:hypothetical protein
MYQPINFSFHSNSKNLQKKKRKKGKLKISDVLKNHNNYVIQKQNC